MEIESQDPKNSAEETQGTITTTSDPQARSAREVASNRKRKRLLTTIPAVDGPIRQKKRAKAKTVVLSNPERLGTGCESEMNKVHQTGISHGKGSKGLRNNQN